MALWKEFRDELGLSDPARIVSGYEAGREGFGLHRFLQAQGVENLIVDSASLEISRRARRAKTDRLDAEKLLTMLQRSLLGEVRVWSVVRVPSIEEEEARSLHREYRTRTKERTRLANRIRGLLANHELRLGPIDGRFPVWLDKARLWDGSAVPDGVRKRIGPHSAWTYGMEFFAGRPFKNGQEVGA